MKKSLYLLPCILLLAIPARAGMDHRDDRHENSVRHERQERHEEVKHHEREAREVRHERVVREVRHEREVREVRHEREERRHEKRVVERRERHLRNLPAGWRRRLVHGRRMDDTLYVHLQAPPRAVIDRLPPPPPDVAFMVLEDQVVQINKINHKILEVLDINHLPVPNPHRLPRLPLPPLP